MRKPLLALILILLFVRPLFAQTADSSAPPLGDVAKKNDATKKDKDSSAKAKRVFTDDNMAVRKSPIPSIALQGSENTEEILTAIHEFRSTHDLAQTEDVVHAWFDEQTALLSGAIDANVRLQKHNQMRMESAQDRSSYPYYNNYAYDGDSSRFNERLTSERWSQRVEARSSQENFQIISRIQQVLMKVRVDVICRPYKTRPAAYDWFKIRTANGVGSY